MTNIEETSNLAIKAITKYLSEVNATSAAETQLALNKLVAVATQSVEVVIDHNAALDMLDGIRVSAEIRNKATSFDNAFIMSSPTSIQ